MLLDLCGLKLLQRIPYCDHHHQHSLHHSNLTTSLATHGPMPVRVAGVNCNCMLMGALGVCWLYKPSNKHVHLVQAATIYIPPSAMQPWLAWGIAFMPRRQSCSLSGWTKTGTLNALPQSTPLEQQYSVLSCHSGHLLITSNIIIIVGFAQEENYACVLVQSIV